MHPAIYERLYGLRTRLLAGTIALTCVVLAFAFRPEGERLQGGAPPAPALPHHTVAAAPLIDPEKANEPAAAEVPLPAQVLIALPTAAPYIVRQGDCIWRIAERFCGSGAHWRELYRANRDRVAHPDLIYPQQYLAVPCR